VYSISVALRTDARDQSESVCGFQCCEGCWRKRLQRTVSTKQCLLQFSAHILDGVIPPLVTVRYVAELDGTCHNAVATALLLFDGSNHCVAVEHLGHVALS